MSFTKYQFTLPQEAPAGTFSWQKTVRYQRLKENFEPAHALYQDASEEVLTQIAKNFDAGQRHGRVLFSVPYQASPAWSGIKTLVDNPLRFAMFLGMVLRTEDAKDVRKAYVDFSSKKVDTRLVEAALWACSDPRILLVPKKKLVKVGTQWVLMDPADTPEPAPEPAPEPISEPISEPIPEATSEPIPEAASEPEPTPESTSELEFEVESEVETETEPTLVVVDLETKLEHVDTVQPALPSDPVSVALELGQPTVVGLNNLAGLSELKSEIAEILSAVRLLGNASPVDLDPVLSAIRGVESNIQHLHESIPVPTPQPVPQPVDLTPMITEVRAMGSGLTGVSQTYTEEIRSIRQSVAGLNLDSIREAMRELRESVQRSVDEIKLEVHRVKSDTMAARREMELLRKDMTGKTAASADSPVPTPSRSSGDSFLDGLAFLKGLGAKVSLSIGD